MTFLQPALRTCTFLLAALLLGSGVTGADSVKDFGLSRVPVVSAPLA